MANNNRGATVAADAEIAERIRAAIEEADTSVNALANHAGMSQKTLDRSLKAGRPLTIQEVGRIAAALNMRAVDFLEAA